MHPIRVIRTLVLAGCISVLVGAGNESGIQSTEDGSVSTNDNTKSAPATIETNAITTVTSREADMPPQAIAGAAPVFTMDWLSVNEGGATSVSSASYQLGHSVGQNVAGFVFGTAFEMGYGFWYGIQAGGCPIALTGDVNLAGGVNSTDIIYLVNFVLKAGPTPFPCEASGDANCTGDVNSTDIIVLVNYVLKGGPAPCNVCTLIPGTWGCL